jgi:uncharacterized protein (TIGR00266 family)
MTDTLTYTLHGSDMQATEIHLEPKQTVRAEPGAMMFKEEGITMHTKTDGGIMAGVKRMFTGESFFISSFINDTTKNRSVTFAAPYPGKIIPLNLAEYNSAFYCQKNSFLCAGSEINVTIAFTKKLGAGLFGGEGFILQKLTGADIAFVHAGGTIIRRDLAQNERLDVDTGCIVGFQQTVAYDIRFIGGIRNTLFGGEGLFLATLKGPGTVYLQSLPLSRLADRLAATQAFIGGQSGGEGGLGNMFGGFVGGN